MSTYCSNFGCYITPTCGEVDVYVCFNICDSCKDCIEKIEEKNEKPVKNT